VAIPETPLSTLRIPVQIDLDYVAQRALQSLPKPLSRDTVHKQVQLPLPGGFGYAPAVGVAIRDEANLEALDLRLDGDTLTAVATVGFKVGTSLEGGRLSVGTGSCGERPGEAPAGIEFTLKGLVSWGTDGQIAFAPRPWTLKWTLPCELTALRIRLEDVLNLPLVRNRVGAAIDGAIRKIPDNFRLRPYAEQAWKTLGQPRLIVPGMYLSVRPESLLLGPLHGNGKILATSLVLHARPRVGVDSIDQVGNLPPLRVDSTPDQGFRLDLQASLPLAFVDSTVSRLLREQDLRSGTRKIRIASARIYGGGAQAVVAVTFLEPFEGEVFLRGVPEFDSVANSIRFAHLDFDLASRSFLVKSASFLLHGTIRETIAKAAVLPIDHVLRPLSQLSIPVTDGTTAKIAVGRLRPLGIAIGDSTIQAWVRAEGKASVVVGSR